MSFTQSEVLWRLPASMILKAVVTLITTTKGVFLVHQIYTCKVREKNPEKFHLEFSVPCPSLWIAYCIASNYNIQGSVLVVHLLEIFIC